MPFKVSCHRILRQSKYKVFFDYHKEVVSRIKEINVDWRKWDSVENCWIMNTRGLYELMKRYRKSNKIVFDFGGVEEKHAFIKQIKKIDEDDARKILELKLLVQKKNLWIRLKDELDKDFEKYRELTHKNLKEGTILYPHQIAGTMFIDEVKSVLLALEMGLGKSQDLDSKLLTPNGWIRMGDVKVGDYVIGSNGKSTKVIGVYPQGKKDIYEIKFNDNTTARSCDEHLWNVNSTTRIHRTNKGIKKYSYQTKTLREIMNEGLQFDNGNNKHYIPIVEPIEFKEKKLKIDPYILGCLLGDGSITTKYGVSFTNIDNEIINEIDSKLPQNHQLVLSGNSKKDYYLTADGKNNYINQNLKEYNLKGCGSHTKFIPKDYMFSSIEDRLEILRGIMDTDGTISSDGMNIDLTLASKQLIDDVKFIVQSLGGIARYKTRTSWYEEIEVKPTYYRLSIKLPPNIIPFKLKRKIERYVSPTKYLPNRAIKEVNYVGKKEAQCIMVDAEDHLYVTDNCILTHNTLSAIAYVEMNNFKRVFVITPNSLKFNFFNEVEKFTHSKAHIIVPKSSKFKNKHTMEESKYIIVNYEYFNSRDKKKVDKKFKDLNIGLIDVLIADECFTYNTLIDTDKGKMKIGKIVEDKLDVKVLSYNHTLKKIETKTISRYLYNGYKDVIKIKLSNGEIIECTPDHKFYSITENKYKPIKNFKYGEKLIKKKTKQNNNTKLPILRERIPNKRTCEKEMLHCNVFNEAEMERKGKINKKNKLPRVQHSISTEKKNTKTLFKKMFNKIHWKKKRSQFTIERDKDMSTMWRGISSNEKKKKEILFNKLFSKMENVFTRNKRKIIYEGTFEKKESIYDRVLQKEPSNEKESIGEDEIEQSNVKPNNSRKNEKKNDWENVFIKGWKWKIDKTTINIIWRNFRHYIYGNGTCDTNNETIKGNGYYEYKISTNTLQSGYWNYINKIINRNRWKISQNKKMEISRQKENRDIEIVWVESIEILESGNRRKFGRSGEQNKRVYDLEIADNHNYFANSILVSNCQALKNTSANTFKNFKRIFNKKVFKNGEVSKVFLSGTPAPNRAHELYTVLNQISPIDFATKKHFNEYYCGMSYDMDGFGGWSTNVQHQKLEELFHKIASYVYRKKKEEVLTDLPDKIYQKIILELNTKEDKLYDQIEEDVVNEIYEKPTSNPLTIMLRLRQYTSSIKVNYIREIIDNILEQGEKVVVVDMFKQSLYDLHDLYPENSALHTGDQTVEDRAALVAKFQDPESNVKIFLASIQTANYGLTLTASSKMIIITLPFSVGQYDQVADRLHRISQKNTVNIYPIIFRDTLDEYVFDVIESKRKEIMKALDNEDYESNISESVLRDVINKLKNKYKE